MFYRKFFLKMFSPDNQIIAFTSSGYEAIVEHIHDFIEIAFIINGQGTHCIQNQEIPVNQGDMFVVATNDPHALVPQVSAEEFKWINCIVSKELLMQYCEDISPTQIVHISDDEYAADILNLLLKEYAEEQLFFQEVMLGQVISLLHIFKRKIAMTNPTTIYGNRTRKEYINTVVNYIHENYKKKITLEELSKVTGVSVGYIEKIFREDRSTSPITYLNIYRIEIACQLLISSSKTILEISEITGFNDVKFFYTVFKRYTELSPGTYRKKKRAEKQYRLL